VRHGYVGWRTLGRIASGERVLIQYSALRVCGERLKRGMIRVSVPGRPEHLDCRIIENRGCMLLVGRSGNHATSCQQDTACASR
jgi:hypothetical protein